MVQIEEDVREKVKSLLRELFQFDNQDLDFGIYRIMNFKRKEIEKFIEQDLIAEAERQFQEYSQAGQADLKSEVDRLRAEIVRDFGEGTLDSEGNVRKNEDAPKVKLYLERKRLLEEAKLTQSQVSDVFNHIYEFFSRYYDKGDFIPKRRYGGKNKYYIPYNGEEVALYWATKDMYYVKTGEFFKKYSFRAGRYLVTFVLTEAKVEVGNVKGEKKYFLLSPDNPVTIDDSAGLVEIRFNYRGLTDEESSKFGRQDVQAVLVNDALEKIAPLLQNSPVAGLLKPRAEGDKPLIEKHLNSYVERNTRDFFIHKNLKEFLENELDFYLKNEMWRLSELEVVNEETTKLLLAKAKAIHKIASIIIEFLDQIEEFQKKLFEKKKLVVKTDYIISLNKLIEYAGEGFFKEIIGLVVANTGQVHEWKNLLLVDIQNSNSSALVNPSNEKFSKLFIDTKYFNQDFKIRLLAAITVNSHLDDILNGVLFRSDNFHALTLLSRKYHDKIKAIYIDPPYNTGKDEFLYKDNLQHSSWLTMILNRLSLAKDLLSEDGIFWCSIDDNELTRLNLLLQSQVFMQKGLGEIIWKTTTDNNPSQIALEHEYVLCFAKNEEIQSNWSESSEKAELINKKYSELKLLFGGNYQKIQQELRKWIKENETRLQSVTHFSYVDAQGVFCPQNAANPHPGGYVYDVIHPITKKVCKIPATGFRWPEDTFKRLVKQDDIYFGDDESTIPKPKKRLSVSKDLLRSVYYEDNRISIKYLDNLFGNRVYDTVKSLKLIQRLLSFTMESYDTVLDFFGGSGTTADAVIRLNQEKGGARKFILVELADYFDTLVIPRLKKVSYSLNWKDGKPEDTKGPGIFVKYHYLEQYDDTLNNIIFKDSDNLVQMTLENLNDFFVRYMLDYETSESPTRLAVERFVKPFDYKIRVINSTEEKTVAVDLVETFNYLLGLTVEKFQRFIDNERVYQVVIGKLENQNVCVIWRDLDQIDLEKDKHFIESKILADKSFDFIFVNGDSYVKNARPIEPEFKRLMGA